MHARHSPVRLIPWVILIACGLAVVHYHFSGSVEVGNPKTQSTEEQIIPRANEMFSIQGMDQSDSRLVAFVKSNYIKEPSNLPYSFATTNFGGTVVAVWPYLQKAVPNGEGGFFVEAGANDGTFLSNTVWLEEHKGWMGLLVECHPESLYLLRKAHRKAYVAEVCLSTENEAKEEHLTVAVDHQGSGSLVSGDNIFPNNIKKFAHFTVQTVPSYTIFAALGVNTIDFFSLDIQSLEYKVLSHFPFDQIRVKVWLIEFNMLTQEEHHNLKSLLYKNGYKGPMPGSSTEDEIYVHESVPI